MMKYRQVATRMLYSKSSAVACEKGELKVAVRSRCRKGEIDRTVEQKVKKGKRTGEEKAER